MIRKEPRIYSSMKTLCWYVDWQTDTLFIMSIYPGVYINLIRICTTKKQERKLAGPKTVEIQNLCLCLSPC